MKMRMILFLMGIYWAFLTPVSAQGQESESFWKIDHQQNINCMKPSHQSQVEDKSKCLKADTTYLWVPNLELLTVECRPFAMKNGFFLDSANLGNEGPEVFGKKTDPKLCAKTELSGQEHQLISEAIQKMSVCTLESNHTQPMIDNVLAFTHNVAMINEFSLGLIQKQELADQAGDFWGAYLKMKPVIERVVADDGIAALGTKSLSMPGLRALYAKLAQPETKRKMSQSAEIESDKLHCIIPDEAEFYVRTPSCLGQGSFKSVQKYIDHDGQAVAVTFASAPKETDESKKSKERIDYESFKKELEVLKEIPPGTPGIVNVRHINDQGDPLVMIQDAYNGGSLQAFMKKNADKVNQQTGEIFKQLVQGFEYLHSRGIIHHDFKLDNVLIDESPNGKLRVGIADFGTSYIKDAHNETSDVRGTPGYVGPEVLYKNYIYNSKKPNAVKIDEVFIKDLEERRKSVNPKMMRFDFDFDDYTGEKLLKTEKSADMWSLGIGLFRMIAKKGPVWTNGIDFVLNLNVLRLEQNTIDEEIHKHIPSSHPLHSAVVCLLQLKSSERCRVEDLVKMMP